MSQDDTVTIRVTVNQRDRMKKFGYAGDSMSIAVENLLRIAEAVNYPVLKGWACERLSETKQ